MAMAGGAGRKRGAVGKESGKQSNLEDEDVLFKLSFVQALEDPQVESKFIKMMCEANKQIADSVSALREEVRSLKAASDQKDATIAELRGEVSQLRLDIDALEQYGRRSSLRISGISEQYEDTTGGVLAVTNGIMELDPPIKPEDINISHRLNKPRGARQEEPRPVIVRFMTKTARYRVIADRKKLKKHNEENNI